MAERRPMTMVNGKPDVLPYGDTIPTDTFEDCPTLKYVKSASATTIGAGASATVDLSSGTTWAINKAWLLLMRCITDCTDYDVYLCWNDNGHDPDGTANDATIPAMQLMERGYENKNVRLSLMYFDEDETSEVHLVVFNNSDVSADFEFVIDGAEAR